MGNPVMVRLSLLLVKNIFQLWLISSGLKFFKTVQQQMKHFVWYMLYRIIVLVECFKTNTVALEVFFFKYYTSQHLYLIQKSLSLTINSYK